ncbi:MAG: hypothetical protein HZA35_01985 [Parcubacteria group bacterium]|nr:hypothetical protein [Parcubacteria group bacterium]
MKEEIRSLIKKGSHDTHEGIHEALRVSVGNGVDLVIYDDLGKFLLLFKKGGGNQTIVSLLDLVTTPGLKDQITIQTSVKDDFFADPFGRKVFISLEKMRDPKMIFAVLRELGHIQVFKVALLNDFKRARHLYDTFAVRTYAKYDIKDWEITVEDERDAWAIGLRMARKLREKYDIDLFKLFKSNNELMGWLRVDQLETYEKELRARGGNARNEKKQQINAWLQTRWEEEIIEGLKKEIDAHHPSDLT